MTIHADAAIAPGAILQANPDSRIIIAAGVCIGMGAILHAHQGTLEVETGATIGASVLVVGKGKIGAHACIGAATTIWNSDIEAGQVVPYGSLVGNKGRQTESGVQSPIESPAEKATKSNGSEPPAAASTSAKEEQTPAAIAPESPSTGIPIYGQAGLNRLLGTLFPHNQSFKRPAQDDNTE